MKIIHFHHFDSDPRFPQFLLYVRWKSGVTFVRRCFRDGILVLIEPVPGPEVIKRINDCLWRFKTEISIHFDNFSIYEQFKFHAQLSIKMSYNLGASSLIIVFVPHDTTQLKGYDTT